MPPPTTPATNRTAKTTGDKTDASLVVRRDETIRLILQFFQEQGRGDLAEHISATTHVSLRAEHTGGVVEAIQSGQYERCIQALSSFPGVSHETLRLCRLAVQSLRFLELLREGRPIDALAVLRAHLQSPSHTSLLTPLLLCQPSKLEESIEALTPSAFLPTSRHALVDALEELLDTPLCLSPHRLEALLQKALNAQLSECPFPHTGDVVDRMSLCRDHRCRDVPWSLTAIGKFDCRSELVAMAISSSSASSSGENCIWAATLDKTLWLVRPTDLGLERKMVLPSECLFVCASREGHRVAVGCSDCSISLFDASTPEPTITFIIAHAAVCGAFIGDRQLVVGSPDDSCVLLYDLSLDRAVFRWSDVYCTALAHVPELNRLVLVHRYRTLVVVDAAEHQQLWHLAVPADVTTVEPHGRFLLLSCLDDCVRVVCLEGRRILCELRGIQHRKFVLNAGSIGDPYIISPSEDGRIVMWHGQSGRTMLSERISPTSLSSVAAISQPDASTLVIAAGDDGLLRKFRLNN